MAKPTEQQSFEDHVRADLLEKIENGKHQVGKPIPSTAELMTFYGFSKTPVRRAVEALQRDGILEGQSGSGVVVKRKPSDGEMASARGVGDQLAHLATEVERVAERVDEINPDLAALKAQVAELQAQIMDLYAKGGYANPYQKPAANSGRKVRSA